MSPLFPDVLATSFLGEGAICEASLNEFTAEIIGRLRVPPDAADLLIRSDKTKPTGNVYFHFPFLFSEVFTAVQAEHLRILSFSGILWMSYMRSQDNTIDGTEPVDPKILFLRDFYLRKSLDLLYGLFPSGSRFWRFYSEYFDQYARAVLLEHSEHRTRGATYSEESFFTVAKGKAAMAKYPIAAQAVLTGRFEKLTTLMESVDYFHVGYQFWDDLVDWKEDLISNNFSFLLSTAIEKLPAETHRLAVSDLPELIGPVLYRSGLADDHLRRALNCFERSHDLAVAAGANCWAAHVMVLTNQVARLAADLKSIMARARNEVLGASAI